jgi:hypothetical protein
MGVCHTTIHPPNKGPRPREYGLVLTPGLRCITLLFASSLFLFGSERRPQG